MSVPPRFSGASSAEEAERLAAILAGRDWKPQGAERVRHVGDERMGWIKSGVIYPDDGSVSMYACWCSFTDWEQEDYGLPGAAYQAFDGLWIPLDT